MCTLSSSRTTLVLALVSLACAAPAAAQQPATTALAPNTITVTGTGTVKPAPADRKSDASIAAAVEAAEKAATPLAIADGQARAKRLADLAGMTLGPLLAIAEASPSSPYAFLGPFGPSGTFGPGRYCGTVRTPIYKTENGKRRRVGVRTRRTCRPPANVSTSLTMTFGAQAAPVPAA